MANVIVPASGPLWTSSNWTFDDLERIYSAVEKIAVQEWGYKLYPNQIEIINSDQMLDAYSSTGLPVLYKHWSFGKQFTQHSEMYKRGMRGLAYEIVINSSPCINYLMEENSTTMQALVLAHAGCGHNHFFANNHMFTEWTDAESIIDYLIFARDYISKCEERYGSTSVEAVLDACHALQNHGVDRFKRPPKLSAAKEKTRQHAREENRRLQANVLDQVMNTGAPQKEDEEDDNHTFLKEPEENVLYFIEKYAPDLKVWQREIIRIVRKLGQYFMPQRLTKTGNEGFATISHYNILTTLHDRGLMTDGAMLEFLASHTAVVTQPSFNDERYSGFNPYALGFDILRDVERAAVSPDDEDREWLSSIAGCGDAIGAIKHAAEDFRDESLIRQFLSPKIIRKHRLFRLHDRRTSNYYDVEAIHNEKGYLDIRETLADSYEWHASVPQIEVVAVDRESQHLTLRYTPYRGRGIDKPDAERVMQFVRLLWTRSCSLVDTSGTIIDVK